MKVSIIGAGKLGAALGRGWAKAGHELIFCARNNSAARIENLCRQTRATIADPTRAAQNCDVLVLALPWQAAKPVVKSLGHLTGKTVLTCMNPLIYKDGKFGFDGSVTTSGAESVASWLPGANVVLALNQVGAEVVSAAKDFSSRPVMFIAGDDESSKSTIISLVSDLGFDSHDAGSLALARLLEPYAMVWINQSRFRGKGREWALCAQYPHARTTDADETSYDRDLNGCHDVYLREINGHAPKLRTS